MAYFGKYDHPDEILADRALSNKQKIKLLESWRDDKEAYIRASEEGMQGDDRADYLRKIENALLELEKDGSKA